MPRSYKQRVCYLCGKVEESKWKRHWERNHPGQEIKELDDGRLPVAPHSNNWEKALVSDLAAKYLFTLQRLAKQSTLEEVKEVPPSDELPEEPIIVEPVAPIEQIPQPKVTVHEDLVEQASKLSYAAQLKMAAKLLGNVGSSLEKDCERLRLWIHTHSTDKPLPSMMTPRDR
jgi:hypothetical protein